MTLLTNTRGPLERVAYSSRDRNTAEAGAAAAYLAVKRFFLRVLIMLAAGCAVATIMAIKVAVYIPRLIHH